MEIRSMLKSDIPQLVFLYKQFWNEESNIDKMQVQFERLSCNDAYVFLSAVENNKLVGSVMGVVCQELYGDCRPFLVMENMIVDQDSRKKGVGKLLFNKLEQIAKMRGCVQIILVTETSRKDACAFYQSCGFQLDHAGYKKKL